MIGAEGAAPIQVYRAENAVDHFLETIIHEKEKIARELNTIVPMQLTEAEEQAFQKGHTLLYMQK